MAPENSTKLLWAAPTTDAPVSGTVHVPGSKSLTNRALLLAALSDGPGKIGGALQARDTELMITALRQFGAVVNARPSTTQIEMRAVQLSSTNPRFGATGLTVDITPADAQPRGDRAIDCGLAGTVMRFLPAAAALHHGRFHFDGDPAAHQRPMAQLLVALQRLGVDLDRATSLPFTIVGSGRISGGDVDIDASASSQFISGLLLAAARFDSGVRVRNNGASLPSQPHIDMSIRMLAHHGVMVDRSHAGEWRIEPQRIRARNWEIEPDLSNAMPFLAAAAMTAGQVTVPGLPPDSLQPITDVRSLLEQFGCATVCDSRGLTVAGPATLRSVDIDMSDIGELVPTAAALCAYADGPSTLRGIGHIRGHETDRISAISTIFAALGGTAHADASSLRIDPAPLRAGVVPTFADHRLATMGALLGLQTPGVLVQDIATTAKTMPNFPEMWLSLTSSVAS